ncbi:hypothetical protein C8R44DRAFT_780709 [Mycena epipterygia]|nr:hypothetical protein C8R44DRAFT_780709 [Mycena epipterygia]
MAAPAPNIWPPFPLTYGELFEFEMPPTAVDNTTTKSTAPWSGLNAPPFPLCYSYLDPSIPNRAMDGFKEYITNRGFLNHSTPQLAHSYWEQLEDDYQGLPITDETWLEDVLRKFTDIVKLLLKDLGLINSLLSYSPHLYYSQRGDKDWLATRTNVAPTHIVDQLVQIMNEAGGTQCRDLGPPVSPPMIGGGCAFELKLSRVLLHFSDFFERGFNTFAPASQHVDGHAIVFKLDLQMQNRVIAKRVSSYAPRYGIVYTAHYFMLAENAHPLAIRAPYSTVTATHEPFSRGPPLTSPFAESDRAVRGVGISRIEHIVGYDDIPFKGFLALLVAINAPPGSFNITGPGPELARPGFDAYNQLYSQPSIPNGLGGKGRLRMLPGRSASKDAQGSNGSVLSGYAALFSTLIQTAVRGLTKIGFVFPDWVDFGPLLYHLTLPRVIIFQFELGFLSQDPRLLIEIPRDVIEKRSHRPCSSSDCSAPLLFSQSQLLVYSFIHFNNGVSVYRGKLDGQTVIVKAYEALGFDGLRREITAYERLPSLPTVPKVVGVFGPSDMAWAALVIEDRGISLDSEQHWGTLPLQERVMIYDTAVDFHLAGVHHGDLAARNFVRDKEGRISIVDFGHAVVGHACEPDVCPELSDLRRNLGL